MEVLRAGWKVKGKVVVKPTVFEVGRAVDEERSGSREKADVAVSAVVRNNDE